jgi:prophage antirepressor-like protein
MKMTPFAFDEFLIRVADRDGEPWFVAKDVCTALGIEHTSRAVEKLDDEEKGMSSIHTLGGSQELLIISESGLYALVLRCRDAMTPGTAPYRFRKWVAAAVLPTIRKTGAYGTHDNSFLLQLADALKASAEATASLVARVRDARRIDREADGRYSRTLRKFPDLAIRREAPVQVI